MQAPASREQPGSYERWNEVTLKLHVPAAAACLVGEEVGEGDDVALATCRQQVAPGGGVVEGIKPLGQLQRAQGVAACGGRGGVSCAWQLRQLWR